MGGAKISVAEKSVLSMAIAGGWPCAILSPRLGISACTPGREFWRKLMAKLSPSVAKGGISVRWPVGTTGIALKTGSGNFCILGPVKTGRAGEKGGIKPSAAAELLKRESHLLENLQLKQQSLDAVLRLGRAFSSIKDLKELVSSTMVRELVDLLNADRGSVFLMDHEKGELYSIVALGEELREIRFPITKGLAGYVAQTGKLLNVRDAHRDPRFNPDIDRQTGYRTRSVLSVPMMNPQGAMIGVIQVINKLGGEYFSRDDEELLRAIASEAASAIINVQLVEEQRDLFESIISAMAAAMDARDSSTAGHTSRVSDYSVGVGKAMGMSRRDLEHLRIAAIMHDLGKIGTPDNILKKPGPLTKEEYEIIKMHAAGTRVILEKLRFPRELLNIAEEASSHHERYDGLGYPCGLKGEQIPMVARILAVADVFDAITSRRHYREAMEIHKALQTIRDGSGTQFCPICVVSFMQYYEKQLKERFESRT